MSNSIKGKIILFITSIVWGFAFVAQSKASKTIEPFTLNGIRCIIGALTLLPFIIFKNIKNKNIESKEEKKENRKHLLIAGISCGIFLCIAMNLQQFGITMYPDEVSSSGRSGFITALYVVLVPIISIFLHKKIKINAVLSVILATIGMYFLCLGNGLNKLYIGDLIVLFSALGFALQILCIDKFSNHIDGVKMSALEFLVCGILSLILMLIFETPNIDNILNCVLPLLYLGVISSGIGYTLQIVGQIYSKNPTIDAIIMSFEAVFAVIGGIIILKESLYTREIIGCIIMFLAIIIAQVPIKIKKKQSS